MMRPLSSIYLLRNHPLKLIFFAVCAKVLVEWLTESRLEKPKPGMNEHDFGNRSDKRRRLRLFIDDWMTHKRLADATAPHSTLFSTLMGDDS